MLALQSRLEQLQKDNIRNELDAKDINKQAEDVKDSANNAHERATQVLKRLMQFSTLNCILMW